MKRLVALTVVAFGLLSSKAELAQSTDGREFGLLCFVLDEMDPSFKLPGQDSMSFGSVKFYGSMRIGEDRWSWRLIKFNQSISLGPFIDSIYPLSATGPNRDSFTCGIGFHFQLR